MYEDRREALRALAWSVLAVLGMLALVALLALSGPSRSERHEDYCASDAGRGDPRCVGAFVRH